MKICVASFCDVTRESSHSQTTMLHHRIPYRAVSRYYISEKKTKFDQNNNNNNITLSCHCEWY